MKTKPDEWTGMAQLYALLKPYDAEQRERMFHGVHAKLLQEQPKKRVRKLRMIAAERPEVSLRAEKSLK
jgi:hypothetical protein